MLISSKNVEIIKNYTKDIKDTTKTIRNVNDLNMAIRDFEHSAFEVQQENNSLKYELEIKDEEYRTTNAIPLFLCKTKEMPSSIAPLSNYMTSAEL